MSPEVSERRQHKRIPIEENAFVVFRVDYPPNIPVIGKILDISKNGLGFYYEDDEKWTHTPNKLTILYGNDNFYLSKVPFEIVSDHLIPSESLFSKTITRRRGVRFGKLDPDQVSQLDYFIKLFSPACD